MLSGRPALSGRRAFTMVEVTITAMLLVIAMTLTLQALGWVAAERRAVDRRQCAIREASNLMERLAARPWEDLTPEALKEVRLSDLTTRALPGAELNLAVDEQDQAEAGDSKRLSLRLRWRNRAGGWEAPVRLSAWISRRGGER